MFDKRLFTLTPGLGRLVAGKVLCMWVGLLANIGFMISVVALLAGLLSGVEGDVAAPMAGDLTLHVCLALACIAVRYVATTISARLGTEAAERVKLALRSRLYRKMLALGPSYSWRVKTADVIQSAGEGIEQIQSFFELFLPQLFYAVLAPVTLFAVVAPLNLPSALTMLICAPLIIIVTGMVSMSAARVFKKYWGRYTDMGATFLDNLQGLETLKNFDADDRAAREMDEKAETFRVMTMRVLQIQLRSLTAMDIVAYGGAAAGIGVALWQYFNAGTSAITGDPWSFAQWAGGMSGIGAYAGYLLSYLYPFTFGGPLTLVGLLLIVLLSVEFFLPMRQLGSFFHVAMNGMTSTKRIFALLDAPEPAHGVAELPKRSSRELSVEFKNVSFTYRDQPVQALRNVSFTALPGRLTAIVGVSGSGKSTAAALLAGSITGYEGTLMLGGVSVADLSGESLAGAVTLIGARSHLFTGTLRGNLLMAAPHASDDALWQALEDAHIADFVRAQEGLEMRIEPDAANLSGGQRQRVAIARALLHDSPIFVFDEATSSVDAQSEALIVDTIRELAKTHGKTVIMITHRMANAEHADQVVVFDHGRVAETGAHGDLMAADGEYAALFRTQSEIERFAGGDVAAHALAGAPQSDVARTGVSAVDASETGVSITGDSVAKSGSFPEPAHDGAPARIPTPKLIMRLLGEARPLAALMAAATLAGTAGHLAATFMPVFGVMAAFALAGAPVWGLSAPAAAAAMALCALLRGVLRYVEQYLNHNVAFHLLAFFRSKAFAALRRLAPAKLAGRGRGGLIAMLTTDVELLEIFFAHTISPVAIAVLTTVTYAAAAALLDPWIALLLLASHVIIAVVVPRFFATGVKNLGPMIRSKASALDDAMLDDMRGLGEIIRFGCGADRARGIESRTKELWAQHARLSRVNARFAGIGGMLVSLLTLIAAGAAIAVAAADSHAIPSSVASFVLFASSFGPTLALSALPANLTQTFASARRLFGLMDETPSVSETGTQSPRYAGMSLDQVTFAYHDANAAAQSPVLSDYSLEVPRRGVLGIQGPSGRGKSTTLKLLMRYWDPQRGQVMFSGVPLPDIDAHHRRRVQTMMSQETHLFDGTIRENLLLALPDRKRSQVDESALRDALSRASVLDLVDSLPEGLDTPVGELGGRLSEGERQRIGLARMFLRDADLMLFDEPTSRLDALNEAVILKSIDGLAHGAGQTKAVVVVSHRQSAMRIADRVVTV